MRSPQLVVCAFDDWTANQLRQLAADHRWVLREYRQPAATLAAVAEPRPTVLLIQADPDADRPDGLRLAADAYRLAPDAATVVLSDVKRSDDIRTAWAAAAVDLGARAVLFPPLTRPVLEDLVSGLMAAAIRRTARPGTPPRPAVDPGPPGTIDLADAGHEDD